MAVEKMKFINIAGRIAEMDNFIINSIVPFDIQLENSMTILDSVKGLHSFKEENPYEKLNKSVAELINVLDHELKYDSSKVCKLMPVSLLKPEIEGYERQIETIRKISTSLKGDLSHKKEIRKQIVPIQNLEVEVDRMFTFEYMKFRFGKMPKESYKKLETYIKTLDVLEYKVSEEDENVYLIYFMPRSHKDNIDSLFASLFFERIRISDDVRGMPKEALKKIDEEIEELEGRIEMLDKDVREFVERNFERLQDLYDYTIQLNEVFNLRRYALRSQEAFYMTGWIPESQIEAFKESIGHSKTISCVFEDDSAVKKSIPPTKLSNFKFFEPFEALVNMYGVPKYNELDPTPFVAVTYMIFFGLMFGDLGQGIVIACLGYFLYRKTKNNLGKLMIYLGCVSSFTGIFYGSVFGNEEILRETLSFIPMIDPMENKNVLLLSTIGFGVVLLLGAMMLNVINSIKQGKIGKLLFDRNGIAGIILYMSLIYAVLSMAQGGSVSPFFIVFLIIGPILIILFSIPLENMLENREHIFPEAGGFFIESIFELLETLLAILSNTISFIRVGAFALNHVGFFMAFHALSDIVAESAAGSAGSFAVMLFGNILIIVLEGLIVAIQGLRLQYYELFSRFFEGGGIAFRPFKIKG